MDRKKILAIEDNTVNLAALEHELNSIYEVIPMISGARAIKFLEKNKVDLILLDIQMPVMDGIETLQVIRTMENGINVPVIFLTANQDKTTVIEGSKLGIVDYVVKPFEPMNLHYRIERALSRPVSSPIDMPNLILKLQEIIEYLHTGNHSTAVIKAEELLGYQLENEIQVRIQNAKMKLKSNEPAVAERMFNRIILLIKHNEDENLKTSLSPISLGELNSRLLYILSDLERFEIKVASEKLDTLLTFAVPDHVMDACTKAKACLEIYDDGGAEDLIRSTLSKL